MSYNQPLVQLIPLRLSVCCCSSTGACLHLHTTREQVSSFRGADCKCAMKGLRFADSLALILSMVLLMLDMHFSLKQLVEVDL